MDKVFEWIEQNLVFVQKMTTGVSLSVTLLISLISDEGLRAVCSVAWCVCVMVMTMVTSYVTAFKD